MASVDYTGRTVDLLIFQGVEEFGNHRITTSWGTAGELCTGVQKIAQSWTILLFTELGTVLNEPTRGCDFLRAIRSGRIQVDEDIPSEFAIASAQISRVMRTDALDQNLPDDERLARTELLDYGILRAAALLYLKVRLHSVAGDSRTVYLPISVSIR